MVDYVSFYQYPFPDLWDCTSLSLFGLTSCFDQRNMNGSDMSLMVQTLRDGEYFAMFSLPLTISLLLLNQWNHHNYLLNLKKTYPFRVYSRRSTVIRIHAKHLVWMRNTLLLLKSTEDLFLFVTTALPWQSRLMRKMVPESVCVLPSYRSMCHWHRGWEINGKSNFFFKAGRMEVYIVLWKNSDKTVMCNNLASVTSLIILCERWKTILVMWVVHC